MFTPALHAPLEELALIEFTGADALSFLQGQLTQDIAGLPFKQAKPAGYCTAKGRLLATMVVWRSERQADTCRALVRADLADALVKRLSMFVLRAKVRVQRMPNPVWGLGLPAAHEAAASEAWAVNETEAGDWIRAPQAPGGDTAIARCWFIGDVSKIEAGDLNTEWAAYWRAQYICAGLPWVKAATQEMFIPQTLNLELIDGVSFTKGCYPGQEVVARSHYRGTIKRRMAAGICSLPSAASAENSSDYAAGTDVFDAQHPDAPWGRVVNLQTVGDQAWLLFEAQLADLEQAQLHLGSAQGPAIQLIQLPYSIAAN